MKQKSLAASGVYYNGRQQQGFIENLYQINQYPGF